MFSGIAPGDVPAFLASQFLSAEVAAPLLGWLLKERTVAARRAMTGSTQSTSPKTGSESPEAH